ncbi:MAG: hypothetical protein COW47_00860 [Candidatus Huberarchaeum crystalense]|uniref:Uncharacterized protein n=1 Tax=Huberarchaeum crystalense TaxID=2014257 RepID=A0A2H9MMM7_HUBC1|nr:MAG: hypothetical protein COW47_00860 [Candidatus Huberarchaeum crystalense]
MKGMKVVKYDVLFIGELVRGLIKYDTEKNRIQTKKLEDSKGSRSCVEQAICYIGLKEYTAAENLLKQAKIKDPINAQAYLYLGVLYEILELYEKAMSEYKQAIKLDKNNYGANFSYGNLCLNYLGKPYDAIEYFKKAASTLLEAKFCLGVIEAYFLSDKKGSKSRGLNNIEEAIQQDETLRELLPYYPKI